jgi:AcrR family transcriptional regulator
MPAGRPKSLDPADALPTIVRMFWRGGYDGSTLDQIATELGVSKPTLCRTLGDKEAIFAAALEAYHREHIEPAERYLDQAETLREALEAVFGLFAERTLTAELPDGCFMGDSGSSGDFVAGPIAATLNALQDRLVASVQGRVTCALAEGELESSTEPTTVVQYLLGQFAAISAISRVQPSRTELLSVVGYMLDGLPWANTRNDTTDRINDD